MQHSSLDSPDVHRQTKDTVQASQQTECYIQRAANNLYAKDVLS